MGTELPHLTTPAMKTLFQTDLFRMKQLVCAYDGMLSDQLPYSYCDTVADFYNSVCWATQDQELRQMILVRLASIGPEHNRWHVGEVLGAIVGRTQDPGALLGLAEHFKRFPAAANWNRQYLEPLPQVLREAMPGL